MVYFICFSINGIVKLQLIYLNLKKNNMKKIIELRNLKDIVNTFRGFDDMYDYLIKTNDINVCNYCIDNDNVWKRLSLKWMINYFMDKEEYEKCGVLKKIIKEHYIASESKQIELHKKMDKFNSLY